MKKIYCIFIGAIILNGCGSNAPKLTPEELAAKKRVTLNIYDDNRVAVQVLRPNRYPSRDFWSWNDNKSEALVYSSGTEYYNALDLIKITKDPKTDVMTAYLKDGTKKTFHKNSFAVLWCNPNKKCSDQNSGSMKAVYEMNLSETPKRDPAYDVKKGDEAKPGMFENEIVILDNAGYAQLNKRVQNMHQRWADAAPAREARARANAEHEASVRKQAIKAGQINCTSTSYSCSGSYSDMTTLNCGNFLSSVWEMRKDGWVIANVNPVWVKGNLLDLCDHNIYHFYYKR